ncbi:MAG TPA: lactate utilization protein, partial [Pirellulales bacterium]|nr:lactate utilization protein [Pirellulales bacterium]
MSRAEFLARVRNAAAAGRAYHAQHAPPCDGRPGYQGAGPDPVAHLAAEVDKVGGQAMVVASLDEARAALGKLIEHYRPRSALCWRHELLDRLGLAEILRGSGIEQLDYDSLHSLDSAEQRAKMLAAEIGITSATVAVAETGTLSMWSSPGSERLASLLPPVHVAIVERAQIVPDLFDFFDQLVAVGSDRMPSNVTLITGPSKTGDLGLRLT